MRDQEHLRKGEKQYGNAKSQARMFIDLQLQGYSLEEAHKRAGYTGSSKDAATRLAAHYRPAIDFRKSQAAAASEDERRAQIERLKSYAEFNLADLYPDGLDASDEWWKKLPRSIKSGLDRIQLETVGTGKSAVRRVKLWPKSAMQAETLLAKILGHFAPVRVEDVTQPEVLDARARLEETIARRLAAAESENDTDD